MLISRWSHSSVGAHQHGGAAGEEAGAVELDHVAVVVERLEDAALIDELLEAVLAVAAVQHLHRHVLHAAAHTLVHLRQGDRNMLFSVL